MIWETHRGTEHCGDLCIEGYDHHCPVGLEVSLTVIYVFVRSLFASVILITLSIGLVTRES
jgi:hypothetical protein